MYFENHRRLRTDRARIILQGGFVRRTDFVQRRSRRFQNFTDAESAADLNKLAARNNDFRFSFCEMANNEHEGGSAIVYDARAFGVTKRSERALQIIAAAAARAGIQIEFEIVVAASGCMERAQCFVGERNATEVSVNQNAGSVDDGLHAVAPKSLDRIPNAHDQVVFWVLRFAFERKFVANRLHNKRVRQIIRADLLE